MRHHQDGHERQAERCEVHRQRRRQIDMGDEGDRGQHREKRSAAREAEESVGSDPPPAEHGEEAQSEEELSGDRDRGEHELAVGEVRDDRRAAPLQARLSMRRRARGRRASRRHRPRRSRSRRSRRLAGRPPVPAGHDGERLVHPEADDRCRDLRIQQDQRKAALRLWTQGPGQEDVGREDQEGETEPRRDRHSRVPEEARRPGGPAHASRRSGRLIGAQAWSTSIRVSIAASLVRAGGGVGHDRGQLPVGQRGLEPARRPG